MNPRSYKLNEPVAGFDEGDVLDVTARFGDWHLYDVKLTERSTVPSGSVKMTDDDLEHVAEPVGRSA